MSEQLSQKEGIRVFVYGSLKQGHCNHPALESAKFLGRCFLEGTYTMVDLGWYPAVVDHGARDTNSRIFGEVYLVDEDTLYTLDCIEGHPSFYKRQKVETPFKKAWCYFLPQGYLERDLELVGDGLWQPNDAEQEWARGITG